MLCQRGSISFYDKVKNVQNGGGVAAVIYNNITSDSTCGDFAGTLGDGNSSTIPAIAVSCADGTYALNDLGRTVLWAAADGPQQRLRGLERHVDGDAARLRRGRPCLELLSDADEQEHSRHAERDRQGPGRGGTRQRVRLRERPGEGRGGRSRFVAMLPSS